MKKNIVVTLLVATMVMMTACDTIDTSNTSVSEVTPVVTESVTIEEVVESVEETVSTEEVEEVEATVEETAPIEVVEEPKNEYGFEEVDFPVWINNGNEWGIYEEPDKNSEKLIVIKGLAKLQATETGIYNDKEWYKVTYEDKEGYIETKKVVTEEPYDLHKLAEEGRIKWDGTYVFVWNASHQFPYTVSQDQIHPDEDYPYEWDNITEFGEDGLEYCIAPWDESDRIGWFPWKTIKPELKEVQLVGIYKDGTFCKYIAK